MTAVPPVRVFVLPPSPQGDSYAFPWSLGFQEEKRLIPITSTDVVGSVGSASFRILRANRVENRTGRVNDPGSLIPGAYIAICAGGSETFSLEDAKWIGVIGEVDKEHLAGSTDYVGTLTARGLGYVLEGAGISGWQQEDGNGGTETIISPPTWNLSDKDGGVVGNVVGVDGNDVFVRTSAACSRTVFGTRYTLLQHLCEYCRPEGVPELVLADSASAFAFLDDSEIPEVLDVRSLTFKGALDYLIPGVRGFGWKIEPQADGSWYVTVFPTIAGEGSTVYPTATPTDVTLPDGTSEVRSLGSGDDIWDAVTVRGERVVSCGSLAVSTGSLTRGWTTTQETAWRAGAAAGGSISNRRDRTEQLREGPGLQDVFTLFPVVEPDTGSLSYTATSSTPTSGGPFFPRIEWDGESATVDTSAYTDPNFPSTRLLRSLPWPVGVKADGTDTRTDEAKNKPTYLEPKAFRYDAGASGDYAGGVWQDLSVKHRHRPGASISVDDRQAALRVKFSPAQWMAKNHWSSGDVVTGGVNPLYENGIIDWEQLVLTVAMESDQRVSVTKYRSNLTPEKVRRELILDVDGLHCWVVLGNTVLGVTSSGGAEATGATQIVRNDYPVAERIATWAAGWAFATRTSVSISLAGVTPPAWGAIGSMLGTVADGSATLTANSTVDAVSISWTEPSPRVTVTTRLPERPELKRISLSIAGTAVQAAGSLKAGLSSLSRDVQRIPGQAPAKATETSVISEEVSLTGHGFTVGNVISRSGSTWDLADISQVGTHAIGVVESVYDANSFRVVWSGLFRGASALFTAGTLYYLSGTTAGLLTSTAPTGTAVHQRAVLYAITDREAEVFSSSLEGTHNHAITSASDYFRVTGSTDHEWRAPWLGWDGTNFRFKPPGLMIQHPGVSPSHEVFSGSIGTPADASTTQPGDILGMVVTKAADADGVSELFGPFEGIYTTGVTPKTGLLYLDPASPGFTTTTRPAKPNLATPVAYALPVGSGGASRIWSLALLGGMMIQRLADLRDVDATGANDGDTLVWDAADEMWYPEPAGAALPDQAANTVYAGPSSGAAAAPTFRALVAPDLGSGAAAGKALVASSGTAQAWVALSGDVTMDSAGVVSIASGVIVDADVNASAAIAWSKISKTSSSLADLATRSAGDLNSGTLPDARLSAVGTAGTYGSASSVPVITTDAKGRVSGVTAAAITPAAIGAVDTGTFGSHTHSIGGDVNGTTAASTVVKIQGTEVDTTGPTAANNLLSYDSTASKLKYVQGLASRGDILTRDATNYKVVALGAAGKVLTSDGTDFSWETPTSALGPFFSAGSDLNLLATATSAAILTPTSISGSGYTSGVFTPSSSSSGYYMIHAVVTVEHVSPFTAEGGFITLYVYKNSAATGAQTTQVLKWAAGFAEKESMYISGVVQLNGSTDSAEVRYTGSGSFTTVRLRQVYIHASRIG